MPLDDTTRVDFQFNGEICENIEFESDEIESKFDDGQLHLALLLASTKIELIYSETIKCVLNMSDEQFEALMGRWGLGGYRNAVIKLNRLSKEEVKNYNLGQCGGKDLECKRNSLAHEDGYVELLEQDSCEADEVKEVLESTIDFINSVVIDDRRNTILPEDN